MAALLGVFLVITIGTLLRGALSRGRDSIYALVGSGMLAMIGLGSITTGGLENPYLSTFFAAVLGLALGQSKSFLTSYSKPR